VVDGRPAGAGRQVPYAYVYRAHRNALGLAFAEFTGRTSAKEAASRRLWERFQVFKQQNAPWLERDALFEALCLEHGSAHWRDWSNPTQGDLDQRLWHPAAGEAPSCKKRRAELKTRYRSVADFYEFTQFVAHEQHRHFREETKELGLTVFGDLQIGFSDQDNWSYQALFLPDYLMGAPPSRTNPDGQPWSYPVLDPAQYLEGEKPGPVQQLVTARMDKMFAEFDGVRIDHPHGLVCPWVYRTDQADPIRAVGEGARLFGSPDLPDHPHLARYAIARPEQLNREPTTPRHADDWVVSLTAEQVDRYGMLFNVLIAAAHKNGRHTSDLVCEVLSTMPYPLQRVLARHRLGRFRVTQKADLRNPGDVYRSENAEPTDWIMVGNHDTKPIWRLIEDWEESGELRERASYLAGRLGPEGSAREEFVERLARDPRLLAQAYFADIFASQAENVMIFFSDLFGLTELYNQPGTISDANWSLRLPTDYRREYLERVAQDRALNLPLALALALQARSAVKAEDDLLCGLRAQAEALAERKIPVLDNGSPFRRSGN
jgi:4-alpha-glucanotransferase